MNDRLSIGANNPPSDEELFAQRIAEHHTGLLEEAEKLAKAKAKPCESDEYAERLTNYIKRIAVTLKALENVRIQEKEPVIKQGKVIDNYFKRIATALEDAKRGAQRPLTDWLQKKAEEEQRIRREAAEQARRDAEEKARQAALLEAKGQDEAAARATESSQRIEAQADKLEASAFNSGAAIAQVVSDKGGSASLRTRWVGEITSRETLDLHELRYLLTDEALQRAVNAYVAKGGRELRGAKIYQTSEATVR